jgi:hypothetical protein
MTRNLRRSQESNLKESKSEGETVLSQECERPARIPRVSLEAIFQLVGTYAREIQNHVQVAHESYAYAGAPANAAEREVVAGLNEIREAAKTIELVTLWFGPSRK